MDTFFLEILSPERVFYKGEAVSLVCPVSDGMLGIMAHHTPLAAAIPDGEITFKKTDGEKTVCSVTSGMVSVSNNHVRLLCKSALAPWEIDEERERRRLNEARLEMKKKQSHKDFALWQMSLNKAVNRLKTKDKESRINM